uniref:Uncharacterized protein n=1 Tax=Rangifer tarandus platyrhynchus TaxID=3082113 RepID=A0ACB0EQ27_RANTA|nr:unnamed protein product [Rangifer tarandus platyrhynchus]
MKTYTRIWCSGAVGAWLLPRVLRGPRALSSEFTLGSSPRLALQSRAIVHRPLTVLELRVPGLKMLVPACGLPDSDQGKPSTVTVTCYDTGDFVTAENHLRRFRQIKQAFRSLPTDVTSGNTVRTELEAEEMRKRMGGTTFEKVTAHGFQRTSSFKTLWCERRRHANCQT